ncbi:tRNA uridine-5-carboxymethylaminomethyl(34) synthesis GTPase MnmE [Helicobacter sp. 13S00482-2]|uniref:tRNA uridine-5-carboxymethylaminomethyl(34) synthesis GTPase MnmE n=1 Tax=Helicobacter sp. 13S00482-2 TaxID=1476200 RepID=UPI000BA5DCB1|nr:tRNA uridine-5-carboxymethylaminomethyl(34) synthesis GTPase MnmE [Helicobacter sp. 13S00482-2]PAF53315.1 tRNA uridine-5-carboxymethylaminomethyl(34) synthesis GTPase MnmE [Helicobacter sp. 13S00482-2]
MNENNTIVAISTPIGIGATAIVRMSGKKALQIALEITKKTNFSPRYATLCCVYNNKDEILDEVIVIYFKNPASYTREDVCEIQCHGGIIAAKMILQVCLEKGATLAAPGEFSKRAFLNGRIDFSQINALSKIIQSTSEKASKILAKQLKGELGKFVDNLREDLLRVLAYSEVMIDYGEEDIPADIISNIDSQIQKIQNLLKSVYEFSKMRQGIIDGHHMSIIGKPNVGKSSVLNAILLYDRAITSPIAGTTRDTIEENINIEGNIIRIIDTAGIRKTQDEIESLGITKSINSIFQSDIILAVFDSSRILDNEDMEIIRLLNTQENKHCIITLNKSDLPPMFELKDIEELIQIPYEGIKISTKTPEKCALALKEIFAKILAKDEIGDEILLTSEFQLQAIKKAICSLENASDVFKNLELELFSYNITEAITNICNITQPYEISEMFDKMFGEFCLGK